MPHKAKAFGQPLIVCGFDMAALAESTIETLRQAKLTASSRPISGRPNRLPHTMLALHGFLGNGQDFEFLRSAREFKDFNLIAPDLFAGPASGQSIREEAAAIAAQALPQLAGAERILLGYSYGARLALEILFEHPTAFTKLVLVSAGFGMCDTEARLARAEQDEKWAQIFLNESWDECLKLWSSQEILAPAGADAQPSGAEPQLGWPGPRDESLYCRPRLAEALRLRGQARVPYYLPMLSQVQIPTLLVVGEEDKKYVEAASLAREQLLRAELVVLKGASHRALFQQPKIFAARMKEFIFSNA